MKCKRKESVAVLINQNDNNNVKSLILSSTVQITPKTNRDTVFTHKLYYCKYCDFLCLIRTVKVSFQPMSLFKNSFSQLC